MKVIGITGGIASGKTFVSNILQQKGFPVFFFDKEAKQMYFLPEVRNKVIKLLGESAYKDNLPDFKFIASKVFKDKQLLQELNNIIYPELRKHFYAWKEKQTSDLVFAEAALFVESGFHKDVDKLIYVYAPLLIRIERWKKREKTNNIDEFFARLKSQLPAIKLFHYSDFIIFNDNFCDTEKQLNKILNKLI